jgi:hypothetical protein
MQPSDEFRTWWAVGAILIVLLIVDVFYFLSAGASLTERAAWFFLGFLTALFVVAAAVLSPRQGTRSRARTR